MKIAIKTLCVALTLLLALLMIVSCSGGNEEPSKQSGQTASTAVPSAESTTPVRTQSETVEQPSSAPASQTKEPSVTTEQPTESEQPSSETPVETPSTVEPTVETPTEQPSTETPVDPGNAVVFCLSSASGKAGEQVTVTVSLRNNPGIAGYSYTVSYDADKLELISATRKYPGLFGTVNTTVSGKARIMATGSGVNPIQGDEICDSIVFKIKDGCAPGTIELTASLADDRDSVFQCFDPSSLTYPNYPAAFESGTITVTA